MIKLPAKKIIRYQRTSEPQKGMWTQGEPKYLFDDLAAAVKAAGGVTEAAVVEWNTVDKDYFGAYIKASGEPYIHGRGPTPTAALLSAITKLNEEAK